VLFGSDDDQFILEAGSVVSNVWFGRGSDRFVLAGGTFTGTLNDVDETLSIDVRSGTLRTNASSSQKVGSFAVGTGAAWQVNVDLTGAKAGSMIVSGVARIDQGATISTILSGATRTPVTINLIQAGSLEWIGTGANVGVTSLPFLYQSNVSRTATSLDLVITPRSVSELGLSASEGTALDSVLALANVSTEVSQAINSQLDGDSWREAYRRLLPDYTDGKISTALAATRGAAKVVRDLAIDGDEQRNYVWAQQFFFGEKSSPTTEQIRQGSGFGLTTGIGTYLGPFDLVGVTAAFTTGRYDRGSTDAEDAEIFSLTSTSVGLVALVREGGLRADLHGSGGYDQAVSTRRIAIKGLDNTLSTGLDQTAKGKANGWRATISGELGYRFNYNGALNVTPFARFDAIKLFEDGYVETGAPGLNLELDSLETTRLQMRAGVEVSYSLGTPTDGWQLSFFGGSLSTQVNETQNRRARCVAARDWFELEPFELQEDGSFGGLKIGYLNASGSGSLNLETEKQGDRANASAIISFRFNY
jgi:Autotransporter beta-domain